MVETEPVSESYYNPMNKSVCIPQLSLSILVYFRLIHLFERYTIYYEVLPLFLRGIVKIFHFTDKRFDVYLSFLTGFKFIKTPNSDQLDDFHNLRLDAHVTIGKITERLTTNLENDPWINILVPLFGKQVALASVKKTFAHFQLFLNYFVPVLCYHGYKVTHGKKLQVIYPSFWPDELLRIIHEAQNSPDIEFIRLPYIFRFVNGLFVGIRLAFLFCKFIFLHGITFRSVEKKRYSFCSEFIDPNRVGQSIFDIDFFIDNKTIFKNDALFYITSNQLKILKKRGFNKVFLQEFAEEKGINLIFLNQLPLTIKFVYHVCKIYFRIFFSLFKYKSSIILNLLPVILQDYLMYSPLFLHYTAKHHLHYQNPNGEAKLKWDSAIITGLCRINNTHSNGFQTRVLHTPVYEFYFDCYDTYFSWGEAWSKLIAPSFTNFAKVIHSGILYMQPIEKSSKGIKENLFLSKTDGKNFHSYSVIIFPTELVQNNSVFTGSFYTKKCIIDFMVECAMLAKSHPHIMFRCKPKDIADIVSFMNDRRFREIYETLPNNFCFLELGRTNYIEVLLESDIALSIGFTSPGIDALMYGKRSIYYSDFRNAGQVFKTIPNFVVDNPEDLKSLFGKLISSNLEWGKLPKTSLYGLDTYRDGKARERIIKHLITS